MPLIFNFKSILISFQHKEDFLFELEMYYSGKDGPLDDEKKSKKM